MNGPAEHVDMEGGAVEFLLRRMQRSQDFPALSESIRTLNRLSASSEKSTEQLAAVIVRDFALTNKILKVVNSAYYASFSGKVGTVSRAIVVLGIESIRALAASLILFEHLSAGSHAERVKALIGKSMFGALVARGASESDESQAEEAFLAAMFHNLGELLVAFYLPEEDEAIQAEIFEEGTPATQAEHKVLGVALEHLGIAVGRHWNFPYVITHCMKKLPKTKPKKPINEEERLRQLACFASEITDKLAAGGSLGDLSISEVLKRFDGCVRFEEAHFKEILSTARSEYRNLAEGLASPEGSPTTIRALIGLNKSEQVADDDQNEEIAEVALPDDDDAEELSASSNPEPVLVDGLQEATAMLAEGSGASQLAQVVLETLYRAFGLRRVALCLRDVTRRCYAGRLGFGGDIDSYLNALQFDEKYSRDVFHVALQRKTDVHIADLAVGGAGHGIPNWYSDISPHGALLFLPLVVRDKPVGCIIAEHARPGGMSLEPSTLRLVRALRNQLALAVQLRA